MSAVSEPAANRGDTDELAQFGYKQELDRSLGSFSSFAAGFSYISILTGVFQLFGFAFLSAGPAFWWSWPIVFIGQFLVAMCFAELAGQYPLAGSVYQWSKQTAKAFTSWMAGWLLIVGSIVTVAAVAVAYQVILPQVTTWFQFAGTKADAGLYSTPGGAKNAVILGVILVVFTTVVNMIGVKLMARINNVGVAAELVGVTLLIILLAVHITRGPGVVLHTNGTGAGHDWGYFGAFLLGSIVSVYVMYGFDTAGSLAEETNNPRKHAPSAILRALAAAGLAGGLLIIVAMMTLSNIGNQRVFSVLISVAIILFYLAYVCVTGPLLLARLRGDWPKADHGPYFSLGRWGMAVNLLAVVYQVIAIVNLAWPREEIYGADHWYFQYG